MYTDSHCHLNFPELMSQLGSIQQAMVAAQVTRSMVICTTMEKFDEVHNLANKPTSHLALIEGLNTRLNTLIEREVGVDDGREHPGPSFLYS